jgi:hypothetical protein
MGWFYAFIGSVGCRETATAYYYDLLTNGEYTIYHRKNVANPGQDCIEILKGADAKNVIERMSFIELYYKLDELFASGYKVAGSSSGGLLEFKVWLRSMQKKRSMPYRDDQKERFMSYRDDQKEWAVNLLPEFFRAEGNGEFNGKAYPFILKDAKLNLWEGIRDDAISYFSENKISWWESTAACPTGHLLSSQAACVNHLYLLRQRHDMATAVLKNIDEDIISAEKLDDGYVEFEVIGQKNYLGERQHTRGANATSVDAVMLGRKAKKNILVLIEWKYTENYSGECLYGTEDYGPRPDLYNPLLEEPECPINKEKARMDPAEPFKALYYEPYYQLMRQTLLGWKMADANEYGADDYIHLHIVPEENREMLEVVTSKELKPIENLMQEAWEYVLKDNSKYRLISPQNFLEPLMRERDTKSLLQYLEKRYWQ